MHFGAYKRYTVLPVIYIVKRMFLFVYLSVYLLTKTREIYHTFRFENSVRIDEGGSKYFDPQILDFQLVSLFSFPIFYRLESISNFPKFQARWQIYCS